MLYLLVGLAFTGLSVLGREDFDMPCLVRNPNAVRENMPPNALKHHPKNKYPDVSALPDSLDWRDKDFVVYASWNRNQHVPQYCGSCWSFAATAALNDRLKIWRDDYRDYEVNLAPQVLLDCDLESNGCHGGDPDNAYEYIMQKGITEESCALYVADGHDLGRECTHQSICSNCAPHKGCWPQSTYRLWTILGHGSAFGEKEIMQALMDGPIVCGLEATKQFHAYINTFDIFNDTTGANKMTHCISIVGYGTEENGDKYWIGRNSWGTWWGTDGFFRIARGSNNLGVESWCSWAIPDIDYKWVNRTEVSKPKPKPKPLFRRFAERPPKSDWGKYGGPVIKSPLPSETIDDSALPHTYVWNDVNGFNFLTTLKNQHLPQYCGSCWAQATTSALSDRINVQRKYESRFPEINLAPQVLVNVNGGGTCNGGLGLAALNYIHNFGIPDETCQNYLAKNNPHGERTELNICYDCVPGNSSEILVPGMCSPVPKGIFDLYYVDEYGPVTGVANMKKEIYVRGPIDCAIEATDAFDAYTGGIYSEYISNPRLNHEISVVGWGVAFDGTEYWVGRNSWGTYWGESGFFRIAMGDASMNLGIETDCSWGVPTPLKPDVQPRHRWNPHLKHFPESD